MSPRVLKREECHNTSEVQSTLCCIRGSRGEMSVIVSVSCY